ncbi:MAG: hypothetical protein ACTHJ1_01190 [Bordetella sp.]|uniref:hypothetical protein n=1 Tax=Bordetella sp. TaxID=28081 RepID=UPI003F7C8F89
MEQNDASISVYKAGAAVMLDAFRTYFTYMERLRDVQRRANAEFAEAIARHAGTLKNANNLTQCSSWQQQAYAEQIGRWNQYALELIQIASEGQALSQVALRDSLAQTQQAYAELATHMPAMPYAFPTGLGQESAGARKPNSQRTSAH